MTYKITGKYSIKVVERMPGDPIRCLCGANYTDTLLRDRDSYEVGIPELWKCPKCQDVIEVVAVGPRGKQ